MDSFIQPVQVRWSDLDPNFHIRHSVYYDWGACCRFDYLNSQGLTTALLQRLHFGPILFREECVFRKEIKYGDNITINLKLIKSKRDFSRWTIEHQIKKETDTLCATVIVDGAWLNVIERKLSVPPDEVKHIFEKMPTDADFLWIDK
jgi:acyl-CoA thioester hydrolase